ncbi:uncharacterized protein [Watersipora subatra]|uniref:uncharacterized protein n=1 Tax=Watersipora subatra TaxID=2589382 RepID=UPI00355C6D04
MEVPVKDIGCGFCLRRNDVIVDGKVLPCEHVHCMECLTSYYELNYMLVCGQLTCRQVVEQPPDALPSLNATCYVCVEKDIAEEEVSDYCVECARAFCTTHLKSHTSSPDLHKTVKVKDTSRLQKELETRYCNKHADQTIDLGCLKCLRLFCYKCMIGRGDCNDGSNHSVLMPKTVVDYLWACDINTTMMRKEMEYEELFKQCSKLHADYELETEAMVAMIHSKKNQNSSLNNTYGDLEKTTLKRRHASLIEIQDFIDRLLKQWVQFRNLRHVFESKFKRSPPADIVNDFKSLKQEMDKHVEDELPRLRLTDEFSLEERESNKGVILEMVPSTNLTVELLTLSLPVLPTSLKLLNSFQLPSCPLSISNYEGNTYVGLENQTVTKIDDDYELHNSFITCPGPVQSLAACKSKIYTLSLADTLTVSVYNLLGDLLTTWKHPHHAAYCDMLIVVANQVLVSNPRNQTIIVYSLDGQILRQLSCPLLGQGHTVLRSFGNSSVIVSNSSSNDVFRLDVATGEIIWQPKCVNFLKALPAGENASFR